MPPSHASPLTIRVRLWDGSEVIGTWATVAEAAADYPYPRAVAWEVVAPKGAFW